MRIKFFFLFFLFSSPTFSQSSKEGYFSSLFSSPLIPQEYFHDSLKTSISNFEELTELLNYFNWTVDELKSFNINSNVNSKFYNNYIFKINAIVESKELNTFTYFKKSENLNDSIAFIVIPGSGLNQSLGIWQEDIFNYNEIVSTLKEF